MSKYIDLDEAKARTSQLIHGYEIEEWLESLPTIEIVRCKECKHWQGKSEHYEDREYKKCYQLCGLYMNTDFFCKYGERIEE